MVLPQRSAKDAMPLRYQAAGWDAKNSNDASLHTLQGIEISTAQEVHHGTKRENPKWQVLGYRQDFDAIPNLNFLEDILCPMT